MPLNKVISYLKQWQAIRYLDDDYIRIESDVPVISNGITAINGVFPTSSHCPFEFTSDFASTAPSGLLALPSTMSVNIYDRVSSLSVLPTVVRQL